MAALQPRGLEISCLFHGRYFSLKLQQIFSHHEGTC